MPCSPSRAATTSPRRRSARCSRPRAHGAWKRTGARSYAAFFRFLLQQAPPSAGAPVGTDNIRLAVRLDRGGDAYAGTLESNIRDLNGAVVFTARGTVSAERIVV